MTTSPNKMSDELRAFRKIYQSRALAVFRKDGERVAYGWSWESLKPELEQLIKQHREAYAEEMEDNLNEIGNKPWRAMRWIAEFLESREGDYNKECAKEYRKLEAFYSNGGFEVIDTLLADETFNLNHPHLIAELREKVGNKCN